MQGDLLRFALVNLPVLYLCYYLTPLFRIKKYNFFYYMLNT